MRVNQKLRAVIIGCGQIAGGFDERSGSGDIFTHAKAYKSQPLTELAAVSDINEQRAREFSAIWGNPKVYSDIDEMLAEESPDIVSICSPDNTHADMLEKCLKNNNIKAVWSEKPLATDINRAETIVSAYKEKGILLIVNYQRRWQPQMQLIKDSIQKCDLGDIQKVVGFYSKGICHNGSHAIDLLLYWFGLPTKFRVFGSHVDFTDDDPTADASLQFNKFPAYLIGFDERAHTLFEIQIIGTLGRVDIKSSGRNVKWYRVQPDPQFAGYQELHLQDEWIQKNSDQTMAKVLQEIIEAIHGEREVRSTGESALATLKTCKEIAELAIKQGQGHNINCLQRMI